MGVTYESKYVAGGQTEVFRKEIREKDFFIDRLRSEKTRHLAEIEALRRRLTDIQIENQRNFTISLDKYSSGNTKEIKDRDVTIKQLREDKLRMEREIKSLKHAASHMKTQNVPIIQSHSDKSLMEKAYQLVQLRAEKASLEKKVESLQKEIQFAKYEQDRYVKIQAETAKEGFRKELREKEYLIEKLRAEKSASDGQIESLRRQITYVQSEKEKNVTLYVEGQTASLRDEIKQKEAMIEQLRAERTRYEKTISGLRKEIVVVRDEGQKKVYQQLESYSDGYRRELQRKEAMIQQLYAEKSKLQSEFERQKQEVYVLQHDFQKQVAIEVAKQAESYQRQIPSLRAEILQYQTQAESVKREMTAIQSKSDYEVSIQVERKSEDFKRQIIEREMEISKLKSETTGYQQKIAALEREVEYKTSITQGYTSEIERLRSDRVKLESEMGTLKKEYTNLKVSSERNIAIQLQKHVDGHRKELMEKEYLIAQLRSEKASIERQVESLKNQITVIQSENEANVSIHVESQTESYKQEVREKEYEIEKLRTERATFEHQLEGMTSQITRIKAENEGHIKLVLESNAEGYESQIKEKDLVIQQLRDEREQYENQIESLRQQIVVIREESNKTMTLQLVSRTEGFRTEINEKEKVIQSLYEERSRLQGEIGNLRHEIVSIKNEGQRNVTIQVEKRVEIYKNEIMGKEKEMQQLRTQVFKLQEEVEASKREITSAHTKSEYTITVEMERRAGEFRKEIRDREVTIGNLRAEMNGLQAQIHALNCEIEYKTSTIQGYSVQIETLRGERQKMEMELGSVKTELVSLRSEGEKVVMLKLQESSDSHRKELMEKEYLISQLRNEKASFERQIESLKTQIEYMESENERNMSIHVESQTETYKQEIREKEYMIERLRTETSTLEQQSESLRNQITQIRAENEKNIQVYIDSGTENYKRELKEKEIMIEALRSERATFGRDLEALRQSHTESYKKEIAHKEAMIQELYSEKSKLQGEVESMRYELMMAKSDSERVVGVEVEKRVEVYRSEVVEKETDIQSLKSQLYKYESEVAFLKQEVDAVQQRNEYNLSIQLESQTESFKQDVREREMTIEGLKAEIESLRREQRNSTAVTEGYLAEIERLKKEISSSSHDKYTLETTRKEHESLKLRYEELNKEKDGLLKARYEVEQELREAKDKLMTAEIQARNNAHREISEYQAKFSDAEQKYQMILIEKKNSENDVQMKVNMAVWEKEETIRCLESETASLRQEVEVLRRSASESFRTEQELTKFTYMNHDYDNLKMKYENVCKEKETLLKDKFAVDYELSAAKAKISDLESSSRMVTSGRQDVVIYQDKYSKLESDYHQLLAEKSRLESELAARVRQEAWGKQEQIYTLEKEVRELKTSNEGYIRSNDEKNVLISKLRMKIAALQGELEQYRKDAYSSAKTSKVVKLISEPNAKENVSYVTSPKSTYSDTASLVSGNFVATSTPRSRIASPSQRSAYFTADDVNEMKKSFENEIGEEDGSMETTIITEATSTKSSPEKTESSENETRSRSSTITDTQLEAASTLSSTTTTGGRAQSYRYTTGNSGIYLSRGYSSGSAYRSSGYYSGRYSSYPVTRKYF